MKKISHGIFAATRKMQACESVIAMVDTALNQLNQAARVLEAPGTDITLLEIGDDIARANCQLQTIFNSLVNKRDAENAFRDTHVIDRNDPDHE